MIIGSFNPAKEEMFTVLDENGSSNEYDPHLSKEECITIYTNMVRSRTMDEKAFKMQRSGKLGTFAQAIGQEGCQAPIALLVDKEDWVVPAFREQCLLLSIGQEMKKFFQYNRGNEWGNHLEGNATPISIVVGGHLLHAVGIAWAATMRKEKMTAFAYCGDGATSEGDFLEALNWAGVYTTPVVFLVQNNQYAISLPRAKQTAAKTLAQKSCAFGFPSILVDGNDVLAVYAAAKEAKQHTREGKGPLLIELYTYRQGPHTTSDDPTLYRDDKEVEEWKKKDPIARFEKYLLKKGYLEEGQKERIIEAAKKEIEEAITAAEKELAKPEDMFNYVYKEKTAPLAEQWKYIQQFIK